MCFLDHPVHLIKLLQVHILHTDSRLNAQILHFNPSRNYGYVNKKKTKKKQKKHYHIKRLYKKKKKKKKRKVLIFKKKKKKKKKTLDLIPN